MQLVEEKAPFIEKNISPLNKRFKIIIIKKDRKGYMLRFLFIMLSGLVLAGCQNNAEKAVGKWVLSSPYYKATYQIFEKGGEVSVRLLSYDDGTTTFDGNPPQKEPFIKDITLTSQVENRPVKRSYHSRRKVKTAFTMVTPNQLIVTSYIAGKPLKEVWNRIAE